MLDLGAKGDLVLCYDVLRTVDWCRLLEDGIKVFASTREVFAVRKEVYHEQNLHKFVSIL